MKYIIQLAIFLAIVSSPLVLAQFQAFQIGQDTPRLDRATFTVPHLGYVTMNNMEQSDCLRKAPVPGVYTGCNVSPGSLSETMNCFRGNLTNRLFSAGAQISVYSKQCYFVMKTYLKKVSDQRNLRLGARLRIDANIPLYFLASPKNGSLLAIHQKAGNITTCDGLCVAPVEVRTTFISSLAKQGDFTLQLTNWSSLLDIRVFPPSQTGTVDMTPNPRLNALFLTNGVSGTFRIFVENSEDVMIFASYLGSNCSSVFTMDPDSDTNCKSSVKDSTIPNLLIVNVQATEHIFYSIEAIRPGKVLKVRTEFIPIHKPVHASPREMKLEHPEHFEVAVNAKTLVTVRVEVISSRGGSFQLFSTNTAATDCSHRTTIFPREGLSCDQYQFATNVTLTKYFAESSKLYFSLFARKTPDIRVIVTHTPLAAISDTIQSNFTAFTEGISWVTFTISKLQYSQLHIHVQGTQDDRLEFYQAKWCGGSNEPKLFPPPSAPQPAEPIHHITTGSLTLRLREEICQYFIGVQTISIASMASLIITPIIRKRLATPQTMIQLTPGSLRELFFYKMIDGSDKREFILTTSYPDAILYASRSDYPNCSEHEREYPSEQTACSVGGKHQLTMNFSKLTRVDIGVFLEKPHTEPFYLIVTPKETCGSGRYFNANSESCAPCPLGCSECADYQGCVSCRLGSLYHNGLCVSTCPKGTFANGPRCTECMSDCLECTSDFKCTECKAGTFFIDGACRTSCPIGSFQSNGRCLKCAPGCESCKDSYSCSRCDHQHRLEGGVCMQACQEGLYNTKEGCLPCARSCARCTSAKECQKCNRGYHLANNQCQMECPTGTYNSGGQCLNCAKNCKACNTLTECVQCDEGFELNDDLSCEKDEQKGWVNYNRCHPRWGSHLVGNSRVTICQGGGLLTAMAMVFTTWRANCQGVCDPANLNDWLKAHGGYNGFRINHQAVDKLGLIYLGTYSDQADWQPHVTQGHGVLLFMKSVRQWVVAKSLTSGKIEGQSSSSPMGLYSYSDVETAIIYVRKNRT